MAKMHHPVAGQTPKMREAREVPLLFGYEATRFWRGMNLIIATVARDTRLQRLDVKMPSIIGC
ncbi:hypothetical protein ACSFA7_04325 [Variovorax sp. LT1R20]|uniref:hypothetical protein n=1 Tax=Variovorax sp. LT1R20 TaxID=3443729 RepID=UPI003F484C35